MPDFAQNLASAMSAPPPAAAAPAASEAPKPAAEPKAAEAPQKPQKVEEQPPKDLTPAEKKLWKLKVDGQEVDFDASDEQTVKNMIAKAMGADKRFQSAAELRKEGEAAKAQATAFLEKLKTDPFSILQDPRIGVDVKKAAEEFLWQQMQEEALSPEERRTRDIERELKKYREQDETAKQTAEREQFEKLQAQHEGQFEQKIITALQSGGIPNTRAAVKKMADYMQTALENDIDLEPKDLVAQVKADLRKDHEDMYGAYEGDALLALLGENLLKKVRNTDLARIKTTRPEANKKPAGTPQRAPKNQEPIKRKFDADEFRESIARKMRGES